MKPMLRFNPGLILAYGLVPILCGASVSLADGKAPLSVTQKGSPLTLADLPALAQNTQALMGQIRIHLSETQALLADRTLDSLKAALVPAMPQPDETQRFSEADLARLMDVDAGLSSHAIVLDQCIEKYQLVTRKLEADRQAMDIEVAKWSELEAVARTGSVAPDPVHALIENAKRSLSVNAQRVDPVRNDVLIALTEAITARSVLDALNLEIASRRQTIGHELLDENREPLWALSGPNESRFQNARKALWTWIQAIQQHLAMHAPELLMLAMGLTGISWFLGGRGALLLHEEVPFSRIARGAMGISKKRLGLALLTLLLGFNLGPKGPIAYYDGIWLLILLPVTALAHAALAPRHWVTLYALGLALIPFPFRTILEPMPWVDRWILNLQAACVSVTLLVDLWRVREEWPARLPRVGVVFMVIASTVLLWIGMGANFLGRTGLAKTLVDGVIGSLGFLMVYSVAMNILFLYVAGLIRSPVGQLFRTASSDPRTLLYGAHRLLLGLTLLMVVWGSLYAFRLDAAAQSLMGLIWNSSLTLGEVDLPLRSVLTSLGVIAVTLGLLRVMRFLLEREILPRFRLSAGVPFAITTLSHYTIAVLGFVLAMTTLGVDLTQISILAGAVGVGVGFGLQNIFNNFISGLILLFERPIHVGDIIEIGAMRGTVTRIGIRSSTLRTPMGAEALMPNGDLIAKEVINWTLSDRRRRIEISVSVAYGSPILKVLDLLTETATLQEDVLDDPAPLAIFANFGESSLDFVLYAWVERFEDTLLAASHLRACINSRFREESIVIPFPQREIHVTPSSKWAPG